MSKVLGKILYYSRFAIVLTLFLFGCNNETFTVNFLDYQGNIVKTEVVQKGDPATPPDAVEVMDGYTFVGWDKEFSEVTRDMNIRPVFTSNAHTVTFYDDITKEHVISIQRVPHQESAELPTPPIKEGFTFIGWDQDLSEVTGDLEVFPIFEPEKYTLSFETNGGNELAPIENIEYNTAIQLPIPKRKGYLFCGWYVSNEENANNFTSQNKVTENLTLYARWRITYLQYYIEEDSIVIHGYQGEDTEVAIPERIEGLPVRSINPNAFFENPTIEVIHVPATVTKIGDYAFSKMPNLKAISIYANEASIGEGILAESAQVETILMPGNSSLLWFFKNQIPDTLTSVTISEGTLWLGNDLIRDAVSVTSIVIPSSVTGLGQYCFANSGIRNIDLSNNTAITEIGDYAFSQARRLEQVLLPEFLEKIGSYAFKKTEALDTILLPNILSIGEYTFEGSTISSIILPDSLTELGKGVFKDAAYLTNITLPEGMKSVSEELFYNALRLENIDLPVLVEKIEKNAFFGCAALTGILLPDPLKEIGDYAFSSCTSLETILFPSGLLSIGNSAFSGCSKLKSIKIPKTVQYLGYSAFSGATSLSSLLFEEQTALKAIEATAFASCSNLRTLELPDGIISIGAYAFSGTNSLLSFVLPTTLTNIGSAAFMGAGSLTSITIPSSVLKIETEAFRDCGQLISVTVLRNNKNNPTALGPSVFSGTHHNLSIYVPGDCFSVYKELENWKTYSNYIKIIEKT